MILNVKMGDNLCSKYMTTKGGNKIVPTEELTCLCVVSINTVGIKFTFS